jgi:hypothetical protein
LENSDNPEPCAVDFVQIVCEFYVRYISPIIVVDTYLSHCAQATVRGVLHVRGCPARDGHEEDGDGVLLPGIQGGGWHRSRGTDWR